MVVAAAFRLVAAAFLVTRTLLPPAWVVVAAAFHLVAAKARIVRIWWQPRQPRYVANARHRGGTSYT